MDPHDLSQLVEHLASDPALASALRVAGSGRRVLARGAAGSSTSFVAGALARRAGKPVVLVVAHLDDADEAADELASAGVPALKFPAIEVLPGETGASLELFGQRVGAVRRVLELLGPAGGAAAGAPVIVCPVQALMQGVPDPARLGLVTLELRPGDARGPTAVIDWLAKAGYVRVDAVEEPGEFAVRGGIIDVFPPGGSASAGGATVSVGVPVRLDFFGDELERLSEIDTGTMGSDRRLDSVELVCMCPQEAEGPEHPEESSPSFLTLIPPDAVVVLSETSEIIEQARGYYERVSHHRSLFGPPEVFRLVQERFGAVVEINQF
ncbi:MAG TPA: hypothetical protein VD963_00680, partial [Phycisphaerales bacterium]|nr:hypothetical protein [Phycisphaerales bacterium]